MKIDLHVHSTASDGSLSPSALTWAARSGGLDIIALTDHDTISGLAEAMASLPDHLHLIPGIELSTTLDHNELHILGYFISPNDGGLVSHTRAATDARAERVRRIIKLLANYQINITFDDVVADVGGSTGVLGRPHIARAMQRKGYVQTISEAFDRFLGDAGPCFQPTELLDPRAAIDMIAAAGGLAVWAHPRPDLFDKLLPQMIEWGMRGVECIRPRLQPSEIQYFEETAKSKNLLISGGSDWHGTWHGKLGEFYVTQDDIAALLEAGGI